MQNSKKIQWFPGHMTKAARQMEENLKKVDFVIEIRDARIPDSSRNPMLDGIIHTKPRLIILSKKDKADPKLTKEWITYLEKDNVRVIALDLVHENYKAAIVQASKTLCASFIEKSKTPRNQADGLASAMVCGIPNVGKSTMINTLAKRKAAKTADKPGVTKSLQWIKLDKDLELLDTPGVLWPKFDDQQIGLKLALLGSIRDEVVTMDELAMFAVEWLMENNPSSLIETYGIEIQDTPWHTLEQVAIKRGYLQKGRIDENRLMNSFVKDMRENKCGLITWEKPNVG